MKTLKEYINESLLDDDILDNEIALVEAFLDENYKGNFIIKKLGDKYIVDSKGNIEVKNKNITSLTNGLFEFNHIGRNFYCMGCNSLKTLEGAPEEVGGNLNCMNCNSLKDLKGAPEKVGGNFNCTWCNSLKSLRGAPKKVGGDFNCSYCDSLKDLKGAPREVSGDFYCSTCGTQFTEEDVRKVCNVKGAIYV